MKIIGHRGAAGLELENTLASLQKAKDLGVDGVEFDLRITRDRQLVLCHDDDTGRVSSKNLKIKGSTLYELRQIRLNNGQTIPTLDQALKTLGTTWAIIEVKDGDCLEELLTVLDQYPEATITVASFDHDFTTRLEEARPEISVYLAEHTKPTEIIHSIRTAKADGMDLNAWVLNPLTYWLARRHNLEIMVYTINSRFVAGFIHFLYPKAAICTDHPEHFIKRRRKS